MATLTLRTNSTAAISINGNFLGFLEENKTLTLPLPSSDTYFTAVTNKQNCNQLNYFITFETGIRLLPCSGRLCRWSEDIYELFFVFEETFPTPPPVILKEGHWDNELIGLCGGYFLIERKSGYKYFPEIIDDYDIFDQYSILKQKDSVIIIDKSFNEILRRDCCAYIKDSEKIILRFTPGEMDFFAVEQVFNGTIISSKIIQADCDSDFDRLRCFCQAVRLNLDFEKFLTPSLKNQMAPNDIIDFLGIFDATDSCRYLPKDIENSLALRYMVDQSNFHYICYRFKIDSGLIDDISEI